MNTFGLIYVFVIYALYLCHLGEIKDREVSVYIIIPIIGFALGILCTLNLLSSFNV